MQAGRVAAARPTSAQAATAFAELCGSPRTAASFMRALLQPAYSRIYAPAWLEWAAQHKADLPLPIAVPGKSIWAII